MIARIQIDPRLKVGGYVRHWATPCIIHRVYALGAIDLKLPNGKFLHIHRFNTDLLMPMAIENYKSDVVIYKLTQ